MSEEGSLLFTPIDSKSGAICARRFSLLIDRIGSASHMVMATRPKDCKESYREDLRLRIVRLTMSGL